jgi:DNA-binding transcriptional LysR family regulator
MVDFRKIEAFCKVCELRSFSKAGEALFLSQPTISTHIQSLERDFEVRLLDRMGRTVLPTPAGTILYRYAKQAFSRLDAARAEIRALVKDVAGPLAIGSPSIPALHVLPEIITAFTATYPNVTPTLMVSSSEKIVKQVREGDIMTGIVGSYPRSDPDLMGRLLLESEILVIAPPSLNNLPLMNEGDDEQCPVPVISFETACSLNWILREESSASRILFEESLIQSGYDPRLLHSRLIVDSAHAAMQYVRAGLGVNASVRIAAQDALLRGEVRAFRIAGVTAIRTFSEIINPRRLTFPTASVFLEFLHSRTTHMRPPHSGEEEE